ncbi:hypothetical protein HanXRQr2_Chr14g0652771 [Helianthus annuus]|uniref:Uncharacterized protein n=1 Tax=Helianthus annuus TaxID=4232 RepID=A0A9K3E9S3_HELAN|nr:hypothetical protein HanXRQr2_Chr14g0652771 [Helianthus annuus]KAJ0841051.1 hypothetical protein HanPSC8_Chr14g0626001 [Helianthus annuus]
MSLFDFIKQDNRIWSPAYGLSQLPSFLIPDISRWGPYQSRNSVLFHVFTHVNSYKSILGVEQVRRKCFC